MQKTLVHDFKWAVVVTLAGLACTVWLGWQGAGLEGALSLIMFARGLVHVSEVLTGLPGGRDHPAVAAVIPAVQPGGSS